MTTASTSRGSFTRDKRFFDLARNVSFKSDHRIRLGAVIVKQGRVVSVGFNRYSKTHPMSNSYNRTLHAEMDAIVGVDRGTLRGSTMYVYREDRNGVQKIAKPCCHCEPVIREVKIKKVIYTTSSGSIGEIKI